MYNKLHKDIKITNGAPLLRRKTTARRYGRDGVILSKEIKSKKYAGVYYRELGGNDRSYFLRIRLGGGTKRIPIGKKSEGITEAFCNQEKIRIINAHRFGDDVAAQLQRVKVDEKTFCELVDYYIETSGARYATIRNIRPLKSVEFADKRRITIQDIQTHLDGLKGRLQPNTINQRLKYIRMIMRYAIANNKYKYSDPTTGVKLLKAENTRKRYLTADEVQTLLSAVKDKPRLYIFVKVALCTGARISTLLKIHERDIKPDGSVRLHNTKSGRYYIGFLDAETMELVEGRAGYIFARRGREDEMPGTHQIQKPLQNILNTLFNPPGTPKDERVVIHTLRHSVATQQIAKGVPMEVIAKTLDHSDIATTARIYAKVAPDLVRRATSNLWD